MRQLHQLLWHGLAYVLLAWSHVCIVGMVSCMYCRHGLAYVLWTWSRVCVVGMVSLMYCRHGLAYVLWAWSRVCIVGMLCCSLSLSRHGSDSLRFNISGNKDLSISWATIVVTALSASPLLWVNVGLLVTWSKPNSLEKTWNLELKHYMHCLTSLYQGYCVWRSWTLRGWRDPRL